MDARLRELERARERSGTVEAEVALLAARRRLGALSGERLELAAALGSPAARLAVGESPATDPRGEGVRSWAQRVFRLGGREAVVRVLVALAIALAERWPPEELDPDRLSRRHAARRALQALEDWLSTPTPKSRKRAARLLGLEHRERPLVVMRDDVAVLRVLGLSFGAVRALATGVADEVSTMGANGVGSLLTAEREAQIEAGFVRSVLVASVVPWALGHSESVSRDAGA